MAEEIIINRMKEFLRGDPEASDPVRQEGLLKTTGLNIEQLARRVKVTKTSIYNYINKSKQPTLDTLVYLAELAGVPLAEVLAYCSAGAPGIKYGQKSK